MSLYDHLVEAAKKSPESRALSLSGARTGTILSYSELVTRSGNVAAELLGKDVVPGDRVAFYLGNRVETVLAFLACLRIGAVVVPINLAYRRREIAHILHDAAPTILLSEAARKPELDQLSEEDRSGLREIVSVEQFLDLQGQVEAYPRIEPEDLALLLYTSGTTGRSKGAMLQHGHLLATITALREAWAWQSSDCLLLALPLFHTHGLIVGLATALASGASVLLHERFDAQVVWRDLTSGEPSLFFGVPTMYRRLLDDEPGGSVTRRLSAMRLFCSGSAPLAAETHRQFQELTGHSILERYGMTETGMNLSNPYRGRRIPGTVGRPLPGVSIRIVDAQDVEVEPGTSGRLLVRGGNVFSGYWRAPEKTSESFVEIGGKSYFRTGDLAKLDPSTGHVTLLGREGDLIISGGLNIYPKEVEEVLTSFPGIAEAAVVARPDREWGESPVAFLVASEEDWDPAQIGDHCREQLATFKVPKQFHRLESLPRNALGKIEKHRLRSMVEVAGATGDLGPPSEAELEP